MSARGWVLGAPALFLILSLLPNAVTGLSLGPEISADVFLEEHFHETCSLLLPSSQGFSFIPLQEAVANGVTFSPCQQAGHCKCVQATSCSGPECFAVHSCTSDDGLPDQGCFNLHPCTSYAHQFSADFEFDLTCTGLPLENYTASDMAELGRAWKRALAEHCGIGQDVCRYTGDEEHPLVRTAQSTLAGQSLMHSDTEKVADCLQQQHGGIQVANCSIVSLRFNNTEATPAPATTTTPNCEEAVKLIDVHSARAGMAVGPDGKLYGFPWGGLPSMLVFDPATQRAAVVSDGVPGGSWQWPLLASDGLLYAAPSGTDSVLAFNATSNRTSSIALGNPRAHYGAVVEAYNGRLYLVPGSGYGLLAVELGTWEISGVPATGSVERGWSGASVAGDGQIYAAPSRSEHVLVISPASNTASFLGVAYADGAADPTASNKWADLVLAPNGRLYGAPYDGRSLLVVDPGRRVAYTVAMDVGAAAFTGRGALLGNGKIYFAPHWASGMLAVDPATETFAMLGADELSGLEWLSTTAGPDGKLYGSPGSSGVLLIADPEVVEQCQR